MVEDLGEALAKAEEEWRERDPAWKRKMDQWEAWKKGSKDRERAANRAKAKKRGEDDEPESVQDKSWESSFNPSDPSPQFTFAGLRTAYSLSKLEEDIQSSLKWVGISEP